MKQRTITIVLVTGLLLFLMVWSFGSFAASNRSKPEANDSVETNESTEPAQREGDEDQDADADLGKWGSRSGIDRGEYLRLRDEYIARKRGIEPGRPFDPSMRGRAIEQMERQEKNRRIESLVNGSLTPPIGTDAAWTPIGPTLIANGQALSGGSTSVSGRVTALVVDPTNPNIVYLGTAQGGVWRSLDGGTTWTAMFDDAQSLAIGALALAPSDPTILYVGTGEFNGCGDCFFGVGLYRIDNANTTSSLVGPINPSVTLGGLTYNVFTGRGITKIVVDPTNAATIFVSTGRGIGGSGGNQFGLVPSLATRGLWRSTNATSPAGSVTFQKLVVTTDGSAIGESPQTGNLDTTDIVMEPGVSNDLLVAVIGASGTNGGIYRTTNALAATPAFTQVYPAATGVRVNLAINKVASVVTAYAATSETPNATPGCTTVNSGAVRKQVDPFNSSSTWANQLTGGGGFCGGQCFYDIAIAVNPNDASEVYLGGSAGTGSCTNGMKKSTTGGASFSVDQTGLHADAHALFYDTAGTTIFTGNDGGVWKRSSSAAPATAWTNLNNALNTLQFESIAVHPWDRNLMIGGTQDNGTEYQQGSVGTWSNAEGGDGGYCLIDQSSIDSTNVTMYHTFFNSTGSQIGFDRIINTSCLPLRNSWPTRGVGFLSGGDPEQLSISCDGTADYLHNGLSNTDAVLFYAPMALGPSSPNTFYFGTDRLYRSIDRGDHMTVVSQASISSPGSNGSPISTIAIWPGGDSTRMVGLQNGQVWATSTGSSTLVNLTSGSFPANPTGSLTNKFVGRAVIDPNNNNVAYVAFSYFAPAGQGIWKITNLAAAANATPVAPVWTASGNGIPSIPINGLVIDPLDSNTIYAGTDIGVYFSTDAGLNWLPFGTGLPRSAVFDVQIQQGSRVLRAGTHGRGVWEMQLGGTPPPTPTPTPIPTATPTPSPTPTPTPTPGCPQNRLQDPGFEASTGSGPISNPFWGSTSTNVGSSLCSAAVCGTNGTLPASASPRNGTYWAWFGGVTPPETGTVSQTVTIPAGVTATLNFYLRIGAVAAPFTDVLNVRVDGTIVQSFNEPSTPESSYTLRTVNLNAYANGASHAIVFEYISPSSGGVANFNLDDVTLDVGCSTFKSKKTGVFRPSTGELFLKNANSSGFADTYIIFGNPGDYPVAGDWNGDGVDSVGIYRNGVFYLRNTNSTGFADIVVPFGNPGDQPVVGDWNGDGVDTIGIYRNGTFILRNSNTAGPPDLVFTLGDPGDVGIAGDWNGDGVTTCGVFRPSNGIVYLKNSNTTGFADLSFVFGNAGDKPVAGDWNADGIDTVGIYRNGFFFLTNSNTTGFADIVFVLGNSGDFPIAGNWNGSP